MMNSFRSWRPGGRCVIGVVFRDPLDTGAVGVHDIYVGLPLAVRAEHDLSARRRPRRVLVAPRPAGQDAEIASVGVYGRDLEETFDLGGEYDLVSPGRPVRGGVVVPFKGDASDIGPVGAHDVQLRGPCPARGEDDIPAVRRP